jgi:hypothetical protein
MICASFTDILPGQAYDWPSALTILNIITAATTTLILVLQYRLSRQRHRLALYDKRYAVFEDTMDLIATIHRDALTHPRLLQFFDISMRRDFLFGHDIRDLLNELKEHASNLWASTEIQSSDQAGNDTFKTSMALEALAERRWFIDKEDLAKATFERYLRMKRR